MDQNDPAWKLAAAAVASLAVNPDALDQALKNLRPSASDIARAYALCLTHPQFNNPEASRLMLNSRLQVALVEEHVAAQRRMGRTINVLTAVLVALTVVLVFFGGKDLLQKARAQDQAARAVAQGPG